MLPHFNDLESNGRGSESLARGWRHGELLLSLTAQFYEFLLIAGAALLYRVARQKRHAVILGVIEALFLFDLTFRTEVLADRWGIGLAGLFGWVALFAVKFVLLHCVFRRTKLRMSGRTPAMNSRAGPRSAPSRCYALLRL